MAKSTRCLRSRGPPIPEPIQPCKLPGQTHEHLHDLKTKQTELETRVSELSRDLKSAEVALKRTRKQVIQLTNDLAPVNRISDEILSSILRTACHLTDLHCTTWRQGLPPRLLFLLRITRVTRRWRTLALADPLLWTRIDVWHDVPPRILALQLKRSGNTAPLDIRFDFGCESSMDPWLEISQYDIYEKFCDTHVEPLLPSVHRWRTLHLRSAGFLPTFNIFARLRPLAAPVLEMMYVGTGNMYNEETPHMGAIQCPDDDYTVFTGGAPKLVSLHVDNLEFPRFFEPPVGNVRTLCVSGNIMFSCREFRMAVAGMQGLEELIIDPYVVEPEWDEDRVVIIPSILSVVVTGDDGWECYKPLPWIIRDAGGKEYPVG
ncbi:hypothetical protein Hypma_007347 [Hypsizygus marmoreus]|uniref:Uncharacterized protein n=1 Tax=Hypsizygus marmoreus TaxID=39966 RepID=A0A369JSV6_HYPMA|nr:hypothetical protein Hypma_007347 [Hypsizygus marmoreus]